MESICSEVSSRVAQPRPNSAWFPRTAPDYAKLAGMSDELIESVNAAYTGGEFQHAKEAARMIPDELVKRIAFCGSPRTALEKVDWLREAGVSGMSVFPLGDNRRETIAHFAELAFERV